MSISTDEPFLFDCKSDAYIRSNVRIAYHRIVYQDNCAFPIIIKLHSMSWYSANSLNLLLIFIESLISAAPNIRLSFELLSKDDIEDILSKSEIRKDDIKANRIKQKIIFFDKMGFADILYSYDFVIYPKPKIYKKLTDHLEAYGWDRFYSHSSRILSLRKLIDNEKEQYSLSNELSTLNNLFYYNLRGHITPEEANNYSKKLTFELVKNIYQHGEKDSFYTRSKGFACAQILKSPLLDRPKVNLDDIKNIFYKRRKMKLWRFLNITINDFGVGLSTKIKNDLLNKIAFNRLKSERIKFDEDFLSDDARLIIFGTTTGYTSKSEAYDETFAGETLQNKGYGLIFCLGMISKRLGRMEIRSGGAKILFISKPEEIYNDAWDNVVDTINLLQSGPEKYLNINIDKLSNEESLFPGTQITIEIPVEVFA